MKNLILSLCLLTLTSAAPILAQEPAGEPAAPSTGQSFNIERHVDVQQTAPSSSTGWAIDQQTMMWIGGLIGVGVLIGLVALASRGGGDGVTVVHD